MVICKKCGKEYIGETGRPIKIRITEHLGYIRRNENQPTGVHFNRCGAENFSFVAFEQINADSIFYRKIVESARINQFQTLEPKGMNRDS